jgi:hypothetical protein
MFRGVKFFFEACGILLHLQPGYASLAPVFRVFDICKYLKVKHLKLHFKFHRVFHKAVENSVENFKNEAVKGLKGKLSNIFRILFQGWA